MRRTTTHLTRHVLSTFHFPLSSRPTYCIGTVTGRAKMPLLASYAWLGVPQSCGSPVTRHSSPTIGLSRMPTPPPPFESPLQRIAELEASVRQLRQAERRSAI